MTRREQNYKIACESYIDEFCHKQGLSFEGWINDIVGEIAYISDMIFNFQDIVWDINSIQPKGLIIKWYNDTYDNHKETGKFINYRSYSKGLRYENLNEN